MVYHLLYGSKQGSKADAGEQAHSTCTHSSNNAFVDSMKNTRCEVPETSAVNDQTINRVEIIEIDDSDSDVEEVIDANANLKRKHFFPDDGHIDTPFVQPTKSQPTDSDQTKNSSSTLSPEGQHALDYPFSNRSSAYIQHISEACTLIMSDARWQTCNKISCSCLKGSACTGKTLFTWEDGDDLSAVKAFMSLYDKNHGPEEQDKSANIDTYQLTFERAMHLYSRMFHRKGPYFDLSDLYDRYYAPKRKTQQPNETEHIDETTVSCEESGTNYDLSSDVSDSAKKVTANERIQRFFTPKASSSGRSTPMASATSSNKSKISDQFSYHLAALELLFIDIHRLLSMGLVRTFESEFECGSVAGHVYAGSNRGSFLLANERREVLSRLGGGKSPKVRSSSPGGDSNNNEILEQMQKQKSMFSSNSFCSDTRNPNEDKQLLPVRKHVDHVLMRKLAVKIASISSPEERAANPRKADVDAAYQLIRTARINTLKHHVSTVCLREAPLTTLRRAMRLFLCASGGPGNMRSDSTNGWLHVPTLHCAKTPNLWHNIVYPGLSSRLGISSYELKDFYVEQQHGTEAIARVFPSQYNFKLFEIGVEIRSFIDRAMEAYEIDRSNRRRKQLTSVEYDSSIMNSTPLCQVHDQFDILHVDGRRMFVQLVFALRSIDTTDVALKTSELIESDINSLHSDENDDGFATDTERMMVALAITCHRVLQSRLQSRMSMSHLSRDLEALCQRPWLRHFSFDSILVYVLWDCIQVLERNGLYQLAISFLATFLLGSTGAENTNVHKIIGILKSSHHHPHVQVFLPRRNRGKAFERLVIDLAHIDKAQKKQENKATTKKRSDTTTKDESLIQQLCKLIISTASITGSIPFCSLRSLSRRLKVPLCDTMKGILNDEKELLNIRVCNSEDRNDVKSSGYNDWTPTTDYAIAHALSNAEGLGKRCSFVGWDSEGNHCEVWDATKSLTVEELALDEYNQGRLPADESLNRGDVEGGFRGWHCEGSHIRAIFRILCLRDLLAKCDESDIHENTFLTPYQTSPYDLHVGAQSIIISSVQHSEPIRVPVRSFYERRRNSIEIVLQKISLLDPQSLCDSIYHAVQKRYQSHPDINGVLKDESLQRDMAQLRTLSCIAAGLGGKTLASIFRTLCFDYRHYCGGLPDLLLVRATYIKESGGTSLVDLSDWIGESFSDVENGSAQRGASMITDDEFLGCSKNGDGLVGSQKSSRKSSTMEPIASLPVRLSLKYSEKDIVVETLLVEVKSANDRLDPRQEDWLNILDSNARVCKFETKKKAKKAKSL